MESHSFASLAHLRILLLPVGSIQQSTFEKYAAEIRSFDEIRLSDIPVDTKDERVRFMPKPMQTGYIHMSFPSHPPPESHDFLSLFRPSHFPLGIIGIASCTNPESLPSTLTQFNSLLLKLFPAGSLFPLAKNCFVFEDSDASTSLNLGDNLPGLIVIPSIMGNKKLYIGTLLADICSSILGEFGRLVNTLESPIGNEYLNSSLFPLLPSISEMPTLLDHSVKLDSLPPLPSHNSQPELGQHPNKLPNGPNLKRNSSLGPPPPPTPVTSTFRQSSLGVPNTNKKRQSGIGAASSHGRLFKVIADLFLLAGRTEDAVIWYTEAIVIFKSSHNTAWHASALEGLATVSVLDSWSAGHGLHTSISNSKEPWNEVSDKLNQAIQMYHKSSPLADEHTKEHFSLLAYLYSSSVLRLVSLLFSVWSAKGWGPLAFTTMLQPGPSPQLPPTISRDRSSWLDLERLSAVTGITRAFIATVLSQAHGPWLLHLEPGDRIAILEAMAGIYGCLGYRRKEVYVLREVLGCIMDLVVCAREDTQSRKFISGLSSTGLGIKGTGSDSAVGIRRNESSDGNESVLKLLKYACKVLGIDLEAVNLVESHVPGSLPLAASEESHRSEYEGDLTDINHESYGWPELQVGVVREALAIAEALPDYPSVAQFALSSLKTLYPVLTSTDQLHLYNTSARALTTARRRGDTKCVEYWSGRPVVSIVISPLPIMRLPIEKPISALDPRDTDVTPILIGATDPFLYNPRKSMTGQGQTLVVQNEIIEIIVTLKNPYIFDLELQTLALSTSGVPFESKATPVIIPANSYIPVTITGKALEPGSLVIRGCIVQAPGGALREFVLPLATNEEEDRQSRRRSAIECETGRFKYSGLESRPWDKGDRRDSSQTKPSNKLTFRLLECKVVAEQPLLRIRRTSLTHGAAMLYDGEMSTIRLTLENVSSLPIDFLRLSFDDSTIPPAQQALAEGEMSVFDTYETEYDLIHRPVFSWHNQEFTHLEPGNKIVVTVNCFGKVGCTHGTIHISYSSIHRRRSILQPSPEVFHTRQLSYPVLVTVYHMLECHGMDILPFTPVEAFDELDGQEQDRRTVLQVGNEASWCLFSIDVRNTYGLPFEVTFERNQEDFPRVSITSIVPPGSTSRIVLPVKKFLLPEDKISQTIPTLSDRQFVVNKSRLTSEQERAQRELFWYREELFRCIHGHWQEAGGIRSGDLSLRQQRMTLPMLETLKTEATRVQITLVQYDTEGMEQILTQKAGKYFPSPNEFLYLRTKVTNLTPATLVLTADFNMEPADHVIHEGVLSAIPVGRLESGQSRDMEMAISFLSYGRFEIVSDIRIVGAPPDKCKAGKGQLVALIKEEPRSPP